MSHRRRPRRDGCNTRTEVLITEALEPPTTGAGCRLSGGLWFSYYDTTWATTASGLDIDHMVPLAEASDSGVSTWTPQRREAYANDQGAAASLVAVIARSNRSKAVAARPGPPDWLLELGLNGHSPPVYVHVGHCWNAGKRSKGLTRDDALRALADGIKPCPQSRPDTELAILD